MSKIFIILLCSLSIFLSSCVRPEHQNYEYSMNVAIENNRLVIFEESQFYRLVYDRETGVEYYMSLTYTSYLTPLLDKYGKQ